jgi:predicted ATP-dependent serine protease
MALRGKKPTEVQKRLKALIYGSAGAGKTTAAIQFPKPYLIDTERGAENAQYVEILDRSGGAYFGTTDFDEMVKEIKALLTEKHDYKTLVIDPLTVTYNDLLDKAAKKVGTEFGRHYGEANKQMKHLLNLLMRLDMNVLITSHSKTEYGEGLVKLGETFDCYKKLDYLFDLVLEVSKDRKTRARLCRVVKSRIGTLPEGDIFPFSYDGIANRYGKDVIERDAQVETFATPEQVKEMKRLIELLKVPEETTDKWLDKAKADAWEEMPTEAIQKCIDHLKGQLSGEAA